MFRSARLKLTLFYLAIFLCFSIALSLVIRVFADREYAESNNAQRSAVHRLILREAYGFSTPPPSDSSFGDFQQDQASTFVGHVNRDLAIINFGALAIGGVISYWFAGRTLRPIEKAHEAQKRFAADASHELRTPLTNMQLENEIFLRQRHFSEDEARTLIKSNLEEVQRLESLSRNLLDLTQYGQAALKLGPVGIAHAIETAAEHARKSAEAKQVRIVVDAHEATIVAHYDSAVQLLDILLDNAIKYGPEDDTVTVHGQRQAGHYVVRVMDQGPGISSKDAPHIFERLYRGDKARTGAGGYGLGLSLAREIARANHAQLSLDTSVKRGACFEVRFDLA